MGNFKILKYFLRTFHNIDGVDCPSVSTCARCFFFK